MHVQAAAASAHFGPACRPGAPHFNIGHILSHASNKGKPSRMVKIQVGVLGPPAPPPSPRSSGSPPIRRAGPDGASARSAYTQTRWPPGSPWPTRPGCLPRPWAARGSSTASEPIKVRSVTQRSNCAPPNSTSRTSSGTSPRTRRDRVAPWCPGRRPTTNTSGPDTHGDGAQREQSLGRLR